jgi:hypothetical protein
MPLYIRGTQNPDGTADRFIVPPDIHPDCPITVKQAFELGLALVELAFEAREMAKRDQQLDGLSDPAGGFLEKADDEDTHPYWASEKGRAQARQEVQTLMKEVGLADLLPSELFGLINVLGEARLRVEAASTEKAHLEELIRKTAAENPDADLEEFNRLLAAARADEADELDMSDPEGTVEP